jgi:PDZ domain
MKVPEQKEESGPERRPFGRPRIGLLIAAGVVALAAMLALASAVVDDARDARAGSREAARAAAEESLHETTPGGVGAAASLPPPAEPALAPPSAAASPGAGPGAAARSRPAAPVLTGVEAAPPPTAAAPPPTAAAPPAEATTAAPPPAAGPRRPHGRSRRMKVAKSKGTHAPATAPGAPAAAPEAARAPERAAVAAAAPPHAGPDAAPRPPGRAVAVAEPARRPMEAENPGAPDEEGELVRVERFAAKGGASLAGRVLDAETGRALGGVVIEARLAGRYMEGSTDPSGAFRMPGMQPGTRVVVWIGGAKDPYVAERLEVSIPAAGQTGETGVVRLLRGDELAGRLDGWVGLFVGRRSGHVSVSAVSPWLPAERAGVQVGDVLVSVDGRDITGLGPRAVTFLLRGPTGTAAAVVAEDRAGTRHKLALERVLR